MTSISIKPLFSISELSAKQWNQLLGQDNPFCRYEFLQALEVSGVASTDNGWKPLYFAAFDDEQTLLAVLPTYLKNHSYGEFVFDWSWANAYQANGLDYYPKLLTGIPMSPVTGPRLISKLEASELKSVIAAVQQFVVNNGLSSWHINFVDQADQQLLSQMNFIERQDIQFHWHNKDYRDFEHFAGQLTAKKRRNITQERNKVFKQGWSFQVMIGKQMSEQDWLLFYQMYLHTFDKKGNWAQLNLDFFNYLGKNMAESVLVIFALHEGQKKAAALFLKSSSHLYGRYWGALQQCPGLHFETCYYQGIEYAIANKLQVFEPGAQGEHKLARGFLPIETYSYHQIVEPEFEQAIRKAVLMERQQIAQAKQYYLQHSPYKADKKIL